MSIRNQKYPANSLYLDKESVGSYHDHIKCSYIQHKVLPKVLENQPVSYLDETLSLFIAAYRKSYGTQHILIRKAEEWMIKFDSDFIVGAILMDLSKAFDCIPYDLVIAKLHAYDFDENSFSCTLT